MKAELDIKPFLKAINEFRTEEQQPCGVQVVEWVGLVVWRLIAYCPNSSAVLNLLSLLVSNFVKMTLRSKSPCCGC